MSGRYKIDGNVPEMHKMIAEIKGIKKAKKAKTNGDAAPSDILPILALSEEGEVQVRPMIWGFLNWDKKVVTYNEHCEAVRVKNSLRKLLPNRKVVIPTNGYYEWKTEDYTDVVNKYRFYQDGEEMLYLAGLYNTFYNRGWPLRERFTMLTTTSNASAIMYNNRMPVLLRKDEIEGWIRGDLQDEVLEREPFEVASELVMANTGEQIMNSL